MTKAKELNALADRVEKLEGACRETDAEIENLLQSEFFKTCNKVDGRWVHPKYGLIAEPQELTSSIDAAMTLVPEGMLFEMWKNINGEVKAILREGVSCYDRPIGVAKTLPNAIVAASLRARIQG